MALIPQWVTGRSVSVFSITPQVVAADGTLSDGTVASLVGLWETIGLESNPETEEISAADAARQSTVILKENYSITATLILRKGVASGAVNPLRSAIVASDVFKIILTHVSNVGATPGTATWTFYGVRGPYRENFAKGKTAVDVTWTMADPGATNPALT